MPVEDPKLWAGPLLFIKSITYPSGSIFGFTVKDKDIQETKIALKELLNPLEEQGILVNSAVLEDQSFLHGAKLVIQTLRGGSFRPNILFLTIGDNTSKDATLVKIVDEAVNNELGVIILHQHPRVAFGMQSDVNLWLRDKSPILHRAILIALQLQLNWEGKIKLITAANNKKEERRLYTFLQNLSDQARLPPRTDFYVISGNFKKILKSAPRGDINIFGLSDNQIPFDLIREIVELTRSSCIFVKDSSKESALVYLNKFAATFKIRLSIFSVSNLTIRENFNPSNQIYCSC